MCRILAVYVQMCRILAVYVHMCRILAMYVQMCRILAVYVQMCRILAVYVHMCRIVTPSHFLFPNAAVKESRCFSGMFVAMLVFVFCFSSPVLLKKVEPFVADQLPRVWGFGIEV